MNTREDSLIEREQKESIFTQSPCICGNLRRAARLVSKTYDSYFQPIGIKIHQYTLLLTIQRLGPVTITKLADEVVLERTTCTRNLKFLENQNLIRFQQGPDKRMKQIVLTLEGREKIKDALPLWEKAQKFMFREVGITPSLDLINELSRIVALLRPK